MLEIFKLHRSGFMSFVKIDVLLKGANDILHIRSVLPSDFNEIQSRKLPDNSVE